MKTSENGLDLIKHYESIHDGDLTKIGLQPKVDPVGIWTVGWGRALRTPRGSWIKDFSDIERYHPEMLTIDENRADELLQSDLLPVENWLNLQESLDQNEFDALVSFAFNCGISALENSTLWRRIKASADAPMITDAFLMWNKGGGKVLNGLTFRRKTEAMLFNNNKLVFYN